MFATRNGTPLIQRNAQRSALAHAADAASLRDRPLPLRFHHLRHTFASHLIVDLGLDVVRVSRILGHASASSASMRTCSTKRATPPRSAREWRAASSPDCSTPTKAAT